MKNGTILLPLEIYDRHLKRINRVGFTPREMDVISCILNRRGSSIAPFLSIGQRSVETHIRNIRQKAGGLAGREQIIDFIEKAGKASIIKNEYYLGLQLRILFEKELREISKSVGDKPLSCFILSGKESQNPPFLLPYLKEHLKGIGCEVKIHHVGEEELFLSLPLGLENAHDGCWLLYILPEGFDEAKIEQIMTTQIAPTIFISPQDIPRRKTPQGLNFVKIGRCENYYLSFFEIVKILFPQHTWDKIIADFKNQIVHIPHKTEDMCAADSSHDLLLDNKKREETIETYNPPIFSWAFLNRRAALCVGILFSLMIFFFYLFVSKGSQEVGLLKNVSYVRSDLVLPHEAVLLQRPEILREIDEKLKGQGGIQSVAIVAQGGAGKTTIARQYAYQQKTNIVWEINAEASESLGESFENLAQALSKGQEDKKILKALLETKNFTEREKRLIEFVKERLKLHLNWLLVYDNVEEFADIQKYFPQDSNTWGEGKIIITTRNHNIQNNRQVNGLISIGELSPSQKLNLYTQIMNQGEKHALIVTQNKELKEFLKQLPPFPLDVSVAAYYLKTTNLPYEKYLERLKQQNKTFTIVQENLLKEAGEYTKTRSGIITLAVNQLIDTQKDFEDLLLFISLLDSQNIPRGLLDSYKEKTIVDNFIYHLKKYSLITSESSLPSIGPTLSIHRSTQAIASAYLTQRLRLERNNSSIVLIGNTLTKYLRNAIDIEDFQRMRSLINHAEAFLSHEKLLPIIIRGEITGELGHLYHILSNYNKSHEYIKNSILIIRTCINKNERFLFRPFSYLAALYWRKGEFKKSQKVFEKCVDIYKIFKIKDSRSICNILTFLGMLYTDQSCFEKAKSVLERALLIHENSSSKNYSQLTFILVNLGHLYKRLGDLKQAKFYVEKALSIDKKHYPADSLTVGGALANLGLIYSHIGYFEKAKNLYEQSLNISKQYFPDTSLAFAWDLRNLGAAYNDLRDFKMALNLLKQSFLIFKKTLGLSNIKTQWVCFHLGEVYKNMGDLQKAKTIFENYLGVYIKNYGKDSIDTGEVLRELGEIYILEKNMEKAEDFLKKALNIYKIKKHPYLYKILELYADFHLKNFLDVENKENLQKSQIFKNQAINNLKQALQIVRTHFPEDSPHIARIQSKLKRLQQD